MNEPINYTREAATRDNPLLKWSNMTADTEGIPIDCANIELLSVAFEGEFAGAEVILEGGIGEEFFLLSSKWGSMIGSRSPAIMAISGRYVKIRPVVLNGNDMTKINVIVLGQNVR